MDELKALNDLTKAINTARKVCVLIMERIRILEKKVETLESKEASRGAGIE